MNDNARDERATDDRPSRASRRNAGPAKPRVLTGREARQGDIILDTPAKRAWFIGGLAACAILLLVVALVK
jgi:hypothetical protein